MALDLGSRPPSWKGHVMQAIVQHGYGAPGDVLKLGEVDTPAVGDQEGGEALPDDGMVLGEENSDVFGGIHFVGC